MGRYKFFYDIGQYCIDSFIVRITYLTGMPVFNMVLICKAIVDI